MQTTQQKPWINLKKLRESRGWQQNEAADKLGFTRTYVTILESGRQGYSINMVNAIIRVFGVSYEDFYKENDDA